MPTTRDAGPEDTVTLATGAVQASGCHIARDNRCVRWYHTCMQLQRGVQLLGLLSGTWGAGRPDTRIDRNLPELHDLQA